MFSRDTCLQRALVCLIALTFLFTARAGTVYVKHDATGANDGSSWANAFTDLQPAIDAAVAGDEVWVAAGTYKPTSWPNGGTTDRERHFSLENGVSVYGGFAGTETLLAERDISANVTICSGDFNGDDIVTGSGATLSISNNSENAFRILYHPLGTSLNATALIDGVFLSGSNGGEGCGAVYNSNSSPTFANCRFAWNVATHGGALNNQSSSPMVLNCNFTLNKATYGGAIHNGSSFSVISNCAFTGNFASYSGGGVYNSSSSPSIENCSFTSNATAKQGGGIYNSSSSSPNIANCTLIRNSASTEGGGIYCFGSTPTIANCTLIENSAPLGGGVYNNSSSLTSVKNCTFARNTGGGIYNYYHSYLGVINSIFWQNEVVEIDTYSPNATVSNCVVEGGYEGGVNIITEDPLLQPLHDNGGQVQTMAIPLVSSAVNQGTSLEAPVEDARGIVRDISPDIGAYENTGALSPWVSCEPTEIAFGTAVLGYEYNIKEIVVRGSALSSAVSIVAPAGFELSEDKGAWSNSLALPLLNGLLETTVYVRFRPLVTTTYSGVIAISSGTESTSVNLSGQGHMGNVVFVAHDGDNSTGANWSTALSDLQTGIELAASSEIKGSEVWVKSGTYTPSSWPNGGSNVREKHFSLRNGVSVYGSFAGTETTVSERNTSVNPTVLSGDLNGDDVYSGSGATLNITNNAENVYHVFYHSITANLDHSAQVDGIVVAGGNANYYSSNNCGGGIRNELSSPMFTGCTITQNTASALGGGVFNSNASPIFTDCSLNSNSAAHGAGMYNAANSSPGVVGCTFDGNLAELTGSGMYNEYSDPRVVNSTFSNNSADSGGGMYNKYSDPLVESSIFIGNSVPDDTVKGEGGGIYNDSSSPTISSCTFNENSATDGGGIYNYSSSPVMTNSTFTKNSATDGGGLYNYNSSDPTITNCTFSDNVALQDGGGIFIWLSSPSFSNCTISLNTAVDGAGVYAYSDSSAIIDGCMIASNVASKAGGGMYASHNPSWSFSVVTNCTFSGNSAWRGGGMYNRSNTTVSNCTFIGNSCDGSVYPLSGGGAISNEYASPTLSNCTFVKNSSLSEGGAMYNYSSSPTVMNCTFSGNSAGSRGGAICNQSSSSPILTNCILWQDHAPVSAEIYSNGSPTLSHCIVEGGYAGGTQILTADPLLQPLYDNGGAVKTMALGLASSAIDSGTETGAPTSDARGVPRQGAGTDIGAFERDGAGVPWLNASPLSLVFPAAGVGNPSVIKEIAITGSLLTQDLTVTAPSGFELSLDGINWTSELTLPLTNGTVSVEIQVWFLPQVVGTHVGTIAATSDTLTAAINVSGDGVATKIYYVSKSGDNSNGLTWVTAFRDLQPAIDAAAVGSGHEVWVAEGTYIPTSWPNGGTAEREKHFSLKNGIGVYGGFAGTETARNQRDSAANITICSGDFNGDDVVTGIGTDLSISNNSENAYHVFYHPATMNLNNTAILDGISVRGGNADFSSSPHYAGGGMYNDSSSPMVKNCIFSSNSAIATFYYGGGGSCMYNRSSSPVLIGCVFDGNNEDSIFNTNYSKPTVTDCIFNGNSGRGMYNFLFSHPDITGCMFTANGKQGIFNNDSSSPTITQCTFFANSGGMHNQNSHPMVANCIFNSNSPYRGAGMCNTDISNPTVVNCEFINNSAGDANTTARGGGMYNENSTSVTITGCTFIGNSSNNQGGAIFNWGSSALLTNCTFYGNSAIDGAGVYDNSYNANNPTMLNCTFSNNYASSYGGALYQSEGRSALANCILWQNAAATGGAEVYSRFSSFPILSHCIVEGGYSNGTQIIDQDPLLGPLQDNGGSLETMALLPSSPAIDSGTSAGAPTTDARGVVRPQRGGIDIGAYEYDGGDWFTVTFSAGAGGSVSGPNPQYAVSGGDLVAVSAVPEGGYVFSGWSGDYVGTENPLTLTDITMDMNIIANFVSAPIADINLPAGISLIGYTGESPIDAQTAFQTLITNNQLSVVRWVDPANGQISELYYTTFPSPAWINEIGDLKLGQGYVVKTTTACTLSIAGIKSTASVSHNLPAGYSIIGFNQETPVDAQSVFQPLINAGVLELVRWVDPANGQIKELYYTTFPSPAWVNEIGNLTEGQGYIIKLNAPHNGFTLP